MKRFEKIANMELRDAMNWSVRLVHGQAKTLAPVNDDGGSGLAGSIHMQVKDTGDELQGRVYTNQEYAAYVEFGTGVKGSGTYPYRIDGLNLTYRSTPWFIPADKIDAATAEKYHFKKVYGKDGAVYYMTYGQEAQPFMYPALKNHEKAIKRKFAECVRTNVKKNSEGGQ
ncbi:MAG: HK97 gp10 family phage protein [Bacteroidaceae bacterium]|nr:HK97 gp10 family phage protein [Bacteroidaceae bacterium]